MRISIALVTMAALATGLPCASLASDWIPTLEAGLKEASAAGQAILYVTKWKPGV